MSGTRESEINKFVKIIRKHGNNVIVVEDITKARGMVNRLRNEMKKSIKRKLKECLKFHLD